jgi:GH25 family lysozyme M1 (1,4-beta-N-acetylmuramidase)
MINPILGIDTWEGQLEIDEAVLKANNVKFVFVRLNNMSGGHHMDTGFAKQWAEASGLYRAPYFVYNPWVNGQANYNWLVANMPPDAKAVAIDIEVVYTGYSPATYAAEVAKFEALVKAKWKYVIYTGEWFLSNLSTWSKTASYWWAQYPLAFYPPSPLTLTWDELRTKLIPFTVPVNVSKVPGTLKFWQFSGDKLTLPGNSKPMDVNVFYGTDLELENFFGAIPTTPPPTPTPTKTIDVVLHDDDGSIYSASGIVLTKQ